MPDQPHRSDRPDGTRALLHDLVPPVDVDAAWSDATGRFRRDRRRQTALRGAGAIGASALVVGLGAVALRVDDARSRQLDVQAPDPATSGSAPQSPVAIGDRLTVSCADGVGSIDHTTVAVRPDGIVVQRLGSGTVTLRPIGGPGAGGLAFVGSFDSEPRVEHTISPGTYEVSCGADDATDNTPGTVIGTVEVIDPDGHYTADPSGMGPEQIAPCADFHSEAYDITGRDPDEVLAWRFGTQAVSRWGYAAGWRQGFTVDGGDGLVAVGQIIDQAPDPLMIVRACAGANPLPAGNGLSAAASLTTEAQAIAWLDAALADPYWSALAPPAGTTVVRREAKLVRQDEDDVMGSTQVPSMKTTAPGFSAWVVVMELVDASGSPSWLGFSFAPDDDTATLAKVGTGPAGITAWPTWFDALPDHAS